MSDEGGVAAVDRALSILDALTDEKITLAELSKRTGLYKSTVLRLAKSLERFGYVLRTEDGSYRLGSKVLYLGSLYQRHFRTSEIVPPVLRSIVEELQEGASFYIVDGEHRIVLHRVDAARTVRDSVHEGDRLPLTHGAAGHLLRAFSGVRGERYERIRDAMFASSFGERDPEIAAFAAPVFGHDNRLVGALNVSGPLYRIEALGEKRIVPALFKHAQALTRTFGGNPDAPEFAGWNKPAGKGKAPPRGASTGNHSRSRLNAG
ncbi:IclR family transcriptional regulator [Ramlibacter henchirensis]|uniref:IclR family transcriptional regulator n=1 Tax=Ramlibacter henchirensis TaxID=204072 RepID=A0A4Z0C171_9BURK|nr:IclR family transcriptional regulator [Ramlibacter henchirensis]TFZ05367.1 IclR family transcriptional regulator [Ramlibacter henchirensis]